MNKKFLYKLVSIFMLLSLAWNLIGITPAYADDGNSTPEPVATSENAETPMPKVVESPVPVQPELTPVDLSTLSEAEIASKSCLPEPPECEKGKKLGDDGKCHDNNETETPTSTPTKTEHPTRTPRPTSTPTQPSNTPTASATPSPSATTTASPTLTSTATVTPGCNVNNPENCPSPTPICGNGEHTGNPHCPTETSTSTPTDVPTNTPTLEPSPTITSTPTATAVLVCEDKDAENYGTALPCVYPTSTSTATSTPAPTLTPTQTPVITPTTQAVKENGEKDKEEKSDRNLLPATGACKGDDKVVFSIGNTDASNIWIYNPELTDGFMATNGVDGWNDAPSFDPNNPCIRFVYNHFSTVDGTGEIWINDGGNHPIEKDGSAVEGLSPDWGSNNKIAYVSIGQIWITNPNGTGQFNTGLYGSQPEWSWDAKALSFINDKGELTLVRTDDWTHIGGLDQSPYSATIWSPDQTMVCDYDWRNQCLLLSGQLTSTTAPYLGFSYEPRGDKVLVIVDSQHLEIRDGGPGFALSKNQTFGMVTDWFTLDKASRITIPGTE